MDELNQDLQPRVLQQLASESPRHSRSSFQITHGHSWTMKTLVSKHMTTQCGVSLLMELLRVKTIIIAHFNCTQHVGFVLHFFLDGAFFKYFVTSSRRVYILTFFSAYMPTIYMPRACKPIFSKCCERETRITLQTCKNQRCIILVFEPRRCCEPCACVQRPPNFQVAHVKANICAHLKELWAS